MLINIQAQSKNIQGNSNPTDSKYYFQYTITIQNLGEMAVQLINRCWSIEDGHTITKVVQGAGVVGKQPVIQPNHEYSYSSWVELSEPVGTMAGYYEFMDMNNQKLFRQQIPLFSLRSDYILN